MSFNMFMHYIVLLVLYFFCANLQSALGFVFISFSYFVVCPWSLILALCLGKLELIGFPSTPSMSPSRVQLFRNERSREAFEKLNSKRKI